jgi:uncharacterized metal-binding protein YceD (DUF177 family)
VSLIDDYLIPFHGLKEGLHEYDFEAGNDFFEFFENPDLKGGDLKIGVELNRGAQFLDFRFKIKGTLIVSCDRCLDEYEHPVNTENELIVRFSDDFEEISDTVITIPREETRFNVAKYIYEFAVLALPVQKVHPTRDDGSTACNTDMIKRLENHLPRDNEQETDPRWDALKNLKSKN